MAASTFEMIYKLQRHLQAWTLVFAVLQQPCLAQQPFPSPESLTYRIEWRMVTAGSAKLQLGHTQPGWQMNLHLESAGLVSRLFRIDDTYKVTVNDNFCGITSNFEAQEGKRHVVQSNQFDNNRHKAIFDENDLARNAKEHHEVDIAPCTYEIVGALEALRRQRVEAGKSITLPIASGKKMGYARIEAQAKETVVIDGKNYPAMRYEAFIFDGVVFRKKGSLQVWLTDDASSTPVQLRFQMGFPIGNITLELEKAERI